MLLFYGEGRFGNQIFQYQALNHLARPGESILALGLEDMQTHLDLHGPRLKVLTRSKVLKRFVKYCIIPLVLRPLARTLRLISYAEEPLCGPDGTEPTGIMRVRRGLVPSMTFVDGGHYQNPSLWPGVFPTLSFELTPRLKAAARRFLDDSTPGDGRIAFVHVRRGDYLQFGQQGLASVALPAEYYFRAIAELERRMGRTHLVFVTDDAGWVEKEFRGISPKTVASFDPATDFAIMAACRAGVASNSTFALAAAYLMADPEVVIVPRYWFGFGRGVWSPPRIFAQHPRLVDVAVHD